MKKYIVALARSWKIYEDGAIVNIEEFVVISSHRKLETARKSLYERVNQAQKNKIHILGWDGENYTKFSRTTKPSMTKVDLADTALGGLFCTQRR